MPKVRVPKKPSSFIEAVKAPGATEFCVVCHAYVLPGHTYHWPTSEFKPGQVRLEGGVLAAECGALLTDFFAAKR